MIPNPEWHSLNQTTLQHWKIHRKDGQDTTGGPSIANLLPRTNQQSKKFGMLYYRLMGLLPVDQQRAAEKQLPALMSLPSDPQKGVYIIDAYH